MHWGQEDLHWWKGSLILRRAFVCLEVPSTDSQPTVKLPSIQRTLSSFEQSIYLSLQNKSLPGAPFGVDYTSLMKESWGSEGEDFLVDKSRDLPLGKTEEVPILSTTITSWLKREFFPLPGSQEEVAYEQLSTFESGPLTLYSLALRCGVWQLLHLLLFFVLWHPE